MKNLLYLLLGLTLLGCQKATPPATIAAKSHDPHPAALEPAKAPEKKQLALKDVALLPAEERRKIIADRGYVPPDDAESREILKQELVPVLAESIQDKDDSKRQASLQSLAALVMYCVKPESRVISMIQLQEREKLNPDRRTFSVSDVVLELDFHIDQVCSAPTVLAAVSERIGVKDAKERETGFA